VSQRSNLCKYVLISPVKDEEKYVERTIQTVLSQTVRPHKWVIVDDGSSDKTPEILEKYARQCDWILVLRLENKLPRQPGAAVIHAFSAGFELIQAEDADFVVKLDCDVKLPAHYFESLITRFMEDPALGIASGVYLEDEDDGWQPVAMPDYHAAGACKMMRTECFREIGGFVEAPGWDTVDEIRAQVLGWKTQHFDDIHFYHLKREGSGIGPLATSVMHGRIYYLTGGGKLFFLLKVLHRMLLDRPFLFSGLALLWGYVKTMLSNESKLVTSKEARFYARLLNRRIWGGLVDFRGASHEGRAWSCD
jgi:biofilm PGA synthesis N-glycosyltransferase PgaC